MLANYICLENQNDLDLLLDQIDTSSLIALDTEADSMHHYDHKLCLIQMKTDAANWLLDPLASLNLKPVFGALENKTLIFHGADYDLRMLWQAYQFKPAFIEDTMIAAQLIGEKSFGLASLVEKYFKIRLVKKFQKADWSLRPLDEELRHYAILDTFFLHDLMEIFRKKLQVLGRLEWFEESCRVLPILCCQPAKPMNPEPWRIKGTSRMKPLELAVFKSLWNWREFIAKSKDKAPYKIFIPQLMIECARRVAFYKRVDLKELPRLPRDFHSDKLDSFLNALAEGLNTPEDQRPERHKTTIRPSTLSPDPEYLETLRIHRDITAEALDIDPTLIANRQQLVGMALNRGMESKSVQVNSVLMNWQFNLFRDVLS
jgi:ribonuclease D